MKLVKNENQNNSNEVTDKEAQETFLIMCKKTGILPAIEACYVIHAAIKEIKDTNENKRTKN